MQVAGEVDALRSNLVLLERSTIDTLRSENEVKLSHTLISHTSCIVIWYLHVVVGTGCTDQKTN